MALQGSLSEFSVLETLQLIGLQKKTGVLQVSSGRHRRTLQFRDGYLVGCQPRQPSDPDPFLAVLAGLGQIGGDDERRYRLTASDGGDTWQRLCESSGLAPETLEESWRLGLQGTLDRILLWTRGRFSFDSELGVPIGGPPISTDSALLESMRRLDEAQDLKGGEFLLASVPVRLPGGEQPTQTANEDGISPAFERAFLARIDGRRTLGDLVKTLGVAEYDVLNAARLLRVRRRIRIDARGRSVEPGQILLEQPVRLRSPLLWVGLGILVVALALSGQMIRRETARSLAILASGPKRATIELERSARAALEVYRLRYGSYPASLGELVECGVWPAKSSATLLGVTYRMAEGGRSYSMARAAADSRRM